MDVKPEDVASPEYRTLLQKRYEQPGWGASGYGWAEQVSLFAMSIHATSILDYGCGRGTLKKRLQEMQMGFDVREYDPGIKGKDSLPEPADLVVATDVLEHIEPALLDNVFNHLKALAGMGIFLNIGLGPAKEILPDGRNAHLLQYPPDAWMKEIKAHGFHIARFNVAKGLNVWVRV